MVLRKERQTKSLTIRVSPTFHKGVMRAAIKANVASVGEFVRAAIIEKGKRDAGITIKR